jgi:hypothetical protein
METSITFFYHSPLFPHILHIHHLSVPCDELKQDMCIRRLHPYRPINRFVPSWLPSNLHMVINGGITLLK